MLPDPGIRTQIGVSPEDPEGRRNMGFSFGLWLSIYAPDGKRLSRKKIYSLAASQRRFYDRSEYGKEFKIA